MTVILYVIANWYLTFVVEMMNTLCNILLVNIIDCVIFINDIWLYISVCCVYVYVAYVGAMRLPNPG
jgi:hypothetical protein